MTSLARSRLFVPRAESPLALGRGGPWPSGPAQMPEPRGLPRRLLRARVSSRQSHGGENRISSARFPARKTLEDFDFDHQRSVRRTSSPIFGALTSIEASLQRSVFGPTRTARATSRSPSNQGMSCRHRVASRAAAEWVDRLQTAHDAGKMQDELVAWEIPARHHR